MKKSNRPYNIDVRLTYSDCTKPLIEYIKASPLLDLYYREFYALESHKGFPEELFNTICVKCKHVWSEHSCYACCTHCRCDGFCEIEEFELLVKEIRDV
jgi:hypothetical protein